MVQILNETRTNWWNTPPTTASTVVPCTLYMPMLRALSPLTSAKGDGTSSSGPRGLDRLPTFIGFHLVTLPSSHLGATSSPRVYVLRACEMNFS